MNSPIQVIVCLVALALGVVIVGLVIAGVL